MGVHIDFLFEIPVGLMEQLLCKQSQADRVTQELASLQERIRCTCNETVWHFIQSESGCFKLFYQIQKCQKHATIWSPY